ncbi:hypothetical protein, partial [Novosphingobium sp. MBES04]|uniref:hypothetical protein n=1 Tax=Novosphingobium sp. MBES04 TaxID=1206458 RepID=UPI000572F713
MNTQDYDDDLMAAVTKYLPEFVPLFRRAIKAPTSYLEALLAQNAFAHGPEREIDAQSTYHCMARDKYVR